MKLKNDFAILLLLPLCIFIYFWIQETIPLYNNQVIKKINMIQYDEGDVEILNKIKIADSIKTIIPINQKINVEDIRQEIKKLYGVKDCHITIYINGFIDILIIPVTIIAQYNKYDNSVCYIDSNWNFIPYIKKIKSKNIVIIKTKNEELLQNIQYQETINKIITSLEGYICNIVIQDNGAITLQDIIRGDMYTLNINDNNLEISCGKIKQKIIHV